MTEFDEKELAILLEIIRSKVESGKSGFKWERTSPNNDLTQSVQLRSCAAEINKRKGRVRFSRPERRDNISGGPPILDRHLQTIVKGSQSLWYVVELGQERTYTAEELAQWILDQLETYCKQYEVRLDRDWDG
ncbi:MAG: hypothetical protein ABSD67_10210 [Terracidiphilus sp.]|jgi:hypothetical protein